MTKTWTICLENQANYDVSNGKNWCFGVYKIGMKLNSSPIIMINYYSNSDYSRWNSLSSSYALSLEGP
jgi:hypothetical protein